VEKEQTSISNCHVAPLEGRRHGRLNHRHRHRRRRPFFSSKSLNQTELSELLNDPTCHTHLLY